MTYAKKLGLAITTAIIAAVLVAPAASAAEFLAEEYPATWSGEQVGEAPLTLNLGEQSVTCESAQLTAVISGAQTSLVASPSFSGCVAFGFSGATVNVNGCAFALLEPSEELAGSLDIECPEGEGIQINAGTCGVLIGDQAGLGGVGYQNSESFPATVTVALGIEEIAYTVVTDGFLCPLPGTGSYGDGTYAGEAEFSGSAESEEAISVAVGKVGIEFPNELVFKLGEIQNFRMKNTGTVNWEIETIVVSAGFKAAGVCEEEGLGLVKAGNTCTESLKCEAVEPKGSIAVRFTYGQIKAVLKC